MASTCREQLVLETHIDVLEYPPPTAVFYPGTTVNGDSVNLGASNPACVEAMLQEVGFQKVELFGGISRPAQSFSLGSRIFGSKPGWAQCGAGGGGRTHMLSEERGILSPVRLPIPPLQPNCVLTSITERLSWAAR